MLVEFLRKGIHYTYMYIERSCSSQQDLQWELCPRRGPCRGIGADLKGSEGLDRDPQYFGQGGHAIDEPQ